MLIQINLATLIFVEVVKLRIGMLEMAHVEFT